MQNVNMFLALMLMLANNAMAYGPLDSSFGLSDHPTIGTGRTFFQVIHTDPLTTPNEPPHSYVTPFKILTQSDGKILVFTNASSPYDIPISPQSVVTIHRFLANGNVDSSFAQSGRAIIYEGEDYPSQGSDATLLPDDSFAIVGTIYNPNSSSDMAVWKFTAQGAVDGIFGSNGLTRLRRGGIPYDAGRSIEFEIMTLAGLAPAPILIVAGKIRDGAFGNHSLGAALLTPDTGAICNSNAGPVCGNVVGGDVGLSTEWRMMRMDTNLCPGGQNIDVADMAAYQAGAGYAIAILLRGCGTTAVVKHSRIGNLNGELTWFVNTGFGNNGNGQFVVGDPNSNTHRVVANALVHAPIAGALGDESLVLAGFIANFNNSYPKMYAARMARTTYTAQSYDFQVPSSPFISPGAYADSLLVQADGKLILGGGTAISLWEYGDAAVLRLNSDLSADSSFGGLSESLPGRMSYEHPYENLMQDNRINAIALAHDNQLLIAGYMNASSNGSSRYGSLMKILAAPADELFKNSFE